MADNAEPRIAEAPAEEIADRVYVIGDRRIPLVPNVGFVVGDRALLVVDTGMGPENGERVFKEAERLAEGRDLYLTLTHFHPEHGFGAQVFADDAVIVYNQSQADEFEEMRDEFIAMFRDFGPGVAACLENVEFVSADITYGDRATIDLGGLKVELRDHGPAHTHGDQVVYVPDRGVMFTGDLVENRFFSILPDDHTHASSWIEVLDELAAMQPAIVVPGHGEAGDAGLITTVRDYLEDVRQRVVERRDAGADVTAAQDELGDAIREDYAEWEAEEWIAPAVERFYLEADRGGAQPADRGP